MSEHQKPIIPPQKELEDEIRKLARGKPNAACPRCGQSGQRFLRRCMKCGRRYRSLRGLRRSSPRIPGHW